MSLIISVLAGGDWSGTFDNYDGAFTPEQIQKYYDIAMDMDWENEWYSTTRYESGQKSCWI